MPSGSAWRAPATCPTWNGISWCSTTARSTPSTGGGYVYIFRGLLSYMNSEAQLAAVIGHEIAHVTARHVAKGTAKNTAASILTIATIILTGSPVLADLASIG